MDVSVEICEIPQKTGFLKNFKKPRNGHYSVILWSATLNTHIDMFHKNWKIDLFNPIPTDVWFIQNKLGELRLPPPFYFLIVILIYNIWYMFRKPLGSTLIIWKKLQIKFFYIYCKIKFFSEKCAKTKGVRNMIK